MVATRGTSFEMARRIFARGADCFGPDEVMAVHGKLHGLKLPKELPPIPWSEEELQAARARDEGASLVLVPPGLTMQALCERRDNQATDGGKILYDTDWYQKESFFTTETTGERWDWRLTTNSEIPDSIDENYLEQTAIIATYLKETMFADRELSAVYQQAIAEFESRREDLTKLMNNWQKAAKQLAALQLNQLCRETPAQVLYRLVTYEVVNHERLLEDMYTWTNFLASDGKLVNVGYFVRRGAFVFRWFPRDSNDFLGVCLSRSGEVEGGG